MEPKVSIYNNRVDMVERLCASTGSLVWKDTGYVCSMYFVSVYEYTRFIESFWRYSCS